MVARACAAADLRVRDIDLLVTNQPNAIFLRNWREALKLSPERHHDTFDSSGNLFGAVYRSTPTTRCDAANCDPELLALGGFAHAGDYAAAGADSMAGIVLSARTLEIRANGGPG